MVWVYKDKEIQVGNTWTDDNDIQHPTNWNIWDDDYKKKMGLTWKDDPKPFDNRFYSSADVAKPLQDVKWTDKDSDKPADVKVGDIKSFGIINQLISDSKEQANSLLESTDWYVLRKAERDVAIPDNVKTYRAAVLTQLTKIETELGKCSKIEDVIALHEATTDKDGKVTANAVMADWPVLG